ncbi:hypothetical protein V6N13_074703 [Hibiscus sabdariffa]|uniref:Uncharacterized protein n=1 Tax=Hibiscus sabdariffa TaxID=183260 RepID=A0ABR2U9D5_9ROSI
MPEMISACVHSEKPRDRCAGRVSEEMEERTVMSCHMGLVDEGRWFFSGMTRDYGVSPEIEHYGCMAVLYSRAGLLHVKPNGVVWGCKVHKIIEVAEEATRLLLDSIFLTMDYTLTLFYLISMLKSKDGKMW